MTETLLNCRLPLIACRLSACRRCCLVNRCVMPHGRFGYGMNEQKEGDESKRRCRAGGKQEGGTTQNDPGRLAHRRTPGRPCGMAAAAVARPQKASTNPQLKVGLRGSSELIIAQVRQCLITPVIPAITKRYQREFAWSHFNNLSSDSLGKFIDTLIGVSSHVVLRFTFHKVHR